MISILKARLKCKRFNIYHERIEKSWRSKYWIYKGIIYYGHPLFIFFVSNQKKWTEIELSKLKKNEKEKNK
jgi:hypothetical protein